MAALIHDHTKGVHQDIRGVSPLCHLGGMASKLATVRISWPEGQTQSRARRRMAEQYLNKSTQVFYVAVPQKRAPLEECIRLSAHEIVPGRKIGSMLSCRIEPAVRLAVSRVHFHLRLCNGCPTHILQRLPWTRNLSSYGWLSNWNTVALHATHEIAPLSTAISQSGTSFTSHQLVFPKIYQFRFRRIPSLGHLRPVTSRPNRISTAAQSLLAGVWYLHLSHLCSQAVN